MKQENYQLCYVEDLWDSSTLLLYFSEMPAKKQWGDDWDDAPYEHNAGTPYEYDYDQPEQGVENGRGIYPKINIFKVYLETRDWKQNFITPRTGCNNSPYSVEDINNGAIPWVVIKENDKILQTFMGGTTFSDFVKRARKCHLKIYRKEEDYEQDRSNENG